MLGRPPSAHLSSTIPRVGVCLALGCLAGSPALADPAGSKAEDQSAGPIVPPRLLQQVVLRYPQQALESELHGDVSVLVDVDASGTVTEVRFESGPEVFVEAALDAARRLTFAPATRDGSPLATTTRVWFHFAPPFDDADGPAVEIVVHGSDPDLEDTRPRTTLRDEDLERSAGDDLAETISQVAGVRLAQGTADASKPIIRGQQERRLLVLFDGVRHESQKWGPDHATEIDPFAAGSISVIRGAAGARFGPDAIGGVILVDPPPLRVEPGIGGKAVAALSSNGWRPYGALRLDAAPAALPGLALRIEGNAAASADRRAPDYVLGNTASQTWNLGGAVGYRWDSGQVRASWHHHDFRAGVFYGVSASTPDEFREQLDADKPVTADLWTSTYAIDRPYQDVSHDVGTLHADVSGSWGTLEAIYAVQINRRQEFEQVRDSITGPQFDFTLRTHSVDTLYRHPKVASGSGTLQGGLGVQGVFQENVYRGVSLLPNYRSFAGGVFAWERLSLARVDLEAGARLDGLSRVAYLSDNDFEAHVRRDTLDAATCEVRESSARCPAAYETGSLSLGAVAHVVPDHVDIKLDLSTSSRFPNVDELYLLGSAPSFPVYASGRPSLGAETSWGGSLTTGLRFAGLTLEASAFGQYVDDYIYFAPELNAAGVPRVDVTIRGAWPSYGFEPINAVVYGADGTLSLGPAAPVGLDARGSLVRMQDAADGTHLVGTPADQLHLALIGRPPSLGEARDLQIAVTTDLVARQGRVDPAVDFAPAPDGYMLLGASLSAAIGAEHPVRVGLEVHNLLDAAYRDYTSLLRYYADAPGRDVRLRVGMDL